MTQTKNPHVLETESIGKLLIQYSIPAIIAMTVTSVYNIVDSIFIGHRERKIRYRSSLSAER